MAVILYPGVIAGRFQHFEGRRNFGQSPGLAGSASIRKGLGQRGHVWIFFDCDQPAQRAHLKIWCRPSEPLHQIRTSAFLKGTNPSDNAKNYHPLWNCPAPALTALSLASAAPNPLFSHLGLLTPSHSSFPFAKNLITNRKHVDTERPVLRQEEDGHRRRPLQGSCRVASHEMPMSSPFGSLPSRDRV